MSGIHIFADASLCNHILIKSLPTPLWARQATSGKQQVANNGQQATSTSKQQATGTNINRQRKQATGGKRQALDNRQRRQATGNRQQLESSTKSGRRGQQVASNKQQHQAKRQQQAPTRVQQATSNKQQAAGNMQRATDCKQEATTTDSNYLIAKWPRAANDVAIRGNSSTKACGTQIHVLSKTCAPHNCQIQDFTQISNTYLGNLFNKKQYMYYSGRGGRG